MIITLCLVCREPTGGGDAARSITCGRPACDEAATKMLQQALVCSERAQKKLDAALASLEVPFRPPSPRRFGGN